MRGDVELSSLETPRWVGNTSRWAFPSWVKGIPNVLQSDYNIYENMTNLKNLLLNRGQKINNCNGELVDIKTN
tara:strand:+ start:300 stop:518 length:219 start_codon:yes stop_codon:yes gene_type:complete